MPCPPPQHADPIAYLAFRRLQQFIVSKNAQFPKTNDVQTARTSTLHNQIHVRKFMNTKRKFISIRTSCMQLIIKARLNYSDLGVSYIESISTHTDPLTGNCKFHRMEPQKKSKSFINSWAKTVSVFSHKLPLYVSG
jgi:hypothetical protein